MSYTPFYMKLSLFLMILFSCTACYGQTIQETLASLGLNFPKGFYNDLSDIPYDYHLEKIGHKINFDTLIITRSENKAFHESKSNILQLHTFETNIFYTDKRTHLITDNILLFRDDSIHRQYKNKSLISISHYISDTLYSIRLYKYKENGELDSLIERGTNFYIANKSDSTHLKSYVNPANLKEYRKNGLLIKVVDEKRGRNHNLIYRGNVLKQINTYNIVTKEIEGVMTFNQQGLLISTVNDTERN